MHNFDLSTVVSLLVFMFSFIHTKCNHSQSRLGKLSDKIFFSKFERDASESVLLGEERRRLSSVNCEARWSMMRQTMVLPPANAEGTIISNQFHDILQEYVSAAMCYLKLRTSYVKQQDNDQKH